MTATDLGLFEGIEILEVLSPDAAAPCRRAAAMAGRLAVQMGAIVHTSGATDLASDGCYQRGKRTASAEQLAAPSAWAAADARRIVLVAEVPNGDAEFDDGVNVVRVIAEPWHTEATLFAASGLADLFGEPDGAPLVPSGEWGGATAAYAVVAALASAQALGMRNQADVATVDCVDALRWVNWKAPAMAWAGAPITREGSSAEWPVLPCADGDVAFVFTDRDWSTIVEMVGDERLADERFARYKRRKEHRGEYLAILAEWTATKTKSELDELFHRWKIPASSVLTPTDLLDDVTLRHRRAFETVEVGGVEVPAPVAPVRVRSEPRGEARPMADDPAALPLAGVRVLDLGVLTAGAGTSSLLSDMGAEVVKIEAAVKPDMFRFWAGADDSPLFHFSNRNKLGVDLNLKDPAGRAAFLDLVAGADAVIENFRRGVLERLELDFDDLRVVSPSIVLASVSGQGLTGPRADHTTFGSTLEAASGFTSSIVGEGGRHYVSGPNLNFPDQTVCLFAGAVITSAIARSRATGEALHLDISQRDVAVYCAGPMVEQLALGDAPREWRMRRPADGERWVAVGADDTTEVVALDGAGVLAACRADGSSAVVEAPFGDTVKGFPFTLRDRELVITRPAPGIGEHDDLVLGKAAS